MRQRRAGLLSNCIEAERRVALLKKARAFERSVAVFGGDSAGSAPRAAVLGDHDGFRGKECSRCAAQHLQAGCILPGKVVGRIEKDDVEAGSRLGSGPVQPWADCLRLYRAAGGELECCEVGPDGGQRRPCVLDKDDALRAATECFDSVCA